MPPIEDDDDLPPMCCEPLAGRCQQIETGLSVLGEVAALTGIAYASAIGDQILGSVFGFTALCFCVVIISNKTCGSLPRIHREFLRASRRLENFKARESAIYDAYQKQIDAFKEVLEQNKVQVQRLHELTVASNTTSERLQVSLADMQEKYNGLLQINKDLKQSTAEKRQIAVEMQKNLETFSDKIAEFRGGIDTAASVISEIKKVEEEFKKVTDGVKGVDDGIKTVSDQLSGNVGESQRLISENKSLQSQLRAIQDELRNEKGINEVLIQKNSELVGALQELSQQLENVKVAMDKDVDAFKTRKEAMKREQKELADLRASIEQARKQAEERHQCCQSIQDTHSQLNELLEATNIAISQQVAQLKREKSDSRANHSPR